MNFNYSTGLGTYRWSINSTTIPSQWESEKTTDCISWSRCSIWIFFWSKPWVKLCRIAFNNTFPNFRISSSFLIIFMAKMTILNHKVHFNCHRVFQTKFEQPLKDNIVLVCGGIVDIYITFCCCWLLLVSSILRVCATFSPSSRSFVSF